MITWLVMILAGAGTYLLRISMLAAHDSFGTPRWLEGRLHLVGPSVLSAILVSSMVSVHGHRTTPDLAALIAVATAFVAVRRTGNIGWALIVGFPTAWAITAVTAW
jgi:branched-subunit amino acid transport protein